jgi:hypothetical protein
MAGKIGLAITLADNINSNDLPWITRYLYEQDQTIQIVPQPKERQAFPPRIDPRTQQG